MTPSCSPAWNRGEFRDLAHTTATIATVYHIRMLSASIPAVPRRATSRSRRLCRKIPSTLPGTLETGSTVRKVLLYRKIRRGHCARRGRHPLVLATATADF